MPILNYTTTIEVTKTAGEIQALLARRGVRRAAMSFDDDGRPSGVSFIMVTDYGPREFALPVNSEGVFEVIKADQKIPPAKRTKEQAERVAWRISLSWLEAQLALVEAGMALLDEVMMPYMLNDAGATFYSVVREKNLKELEA